MTEFQVWAPYVKSVQLELAGRRIPMNAGELGWWRVEVAEASAGTDYGFVLDGGGPLPDPRSPWQPHGVHGLSRLVDHDAFVWHDRQWQAPPLSSGLVYELHVGTFTPEGTFEAAIERLDYLRDLGVTHVELMPVNEFSGRRGWGYDGVDLYAPHHAYGGPEGLKRLVDACHGCGLAVLLDVVYNHLGPAGNYLNRFGPYLTDWYKTPWGPAVNLDGARSDEVRRFLIDNALMWLRDYHFDGLRIDAIHAFHDVSAVHFLEQLAIEVEQLEAILGRRLVLIAESDLNDPRVVRSREAGGLGMHAQWNDDFHHALHAVLTGERNGYYEDFGRLAQVARALQRAYVYDGQYSRHRWRRHGRPVGGLPGHRFVGYLQNHDQIGNRAQGERISQLVSLGRLKIGAALVLTSPFVPMLFQGEEWGASTPFQYFTDHQDPALAKAVTEGRRREFSTFGWKPEEVPDPQALTTFERSRLNWDERHRAPHAEILEGYRRLIRLRRNVPALRDGRLSEVRTRFDEEACWLVVERGPIAVACNLADKAQRVAISEGCGRELLLSSDAGIRIVPNGLELPPESVAILGPGGIAV